MSSYYQMHKPTPEMCDLLKRLQALKDKGLAVACELIAQSVWSQQKKRHDAGRWWPWLFRRSPANEWELRWHQGHGLPPGHDHPSSYVTKSGERVLVFEPYGLGHNTLKALLAWCEARQLECSVSGQSSWFPGRTVLVEITKREGAAYIHPKKLAATRAGVSDE